MERQLRLIDVVIQFQNGFTVLLIQMVVSSHGFCLQEYKEIVTLTFWTYFYHPKLGRKKAHIFVLWSACPHDSDTTIIGFVTGFVMKSPPPGQNKYRRIDGADSASNAVGKGLIELEVLSISGECMLTLNVADSMLGRELWKMILDKIPSKPGLQLVVSHNSRLVLHESLQQQGLRGPRAQVSATYMPINLHAAWRFARGGSVEDEEFSLNGIREVTEASDEMPALLRNFAPKPSHLEFW